MPTYKCPKCGKTVELPPGKYYCKECSTLFKKVWMEEVRPPRPPPPPPPPVIQMLIDKGLLLWETESEDSVHSFLVNIEPRREWELVVDYEDKTFCFAIGDYWGSFFKEHYDVIER